MDNDKQVKDLIARTRDQFLSAPLTPDDLQVDQYDIEREFEASRKNRNLVIPLILGGFLILATLAAIGVSWLIDDSNRKAKVSVEQFEDLNLRDVLDTAKKNQDNLNTAKQALADATSERSRRLSQAEGEANGRLDLLAQSGLPDSEVADRKAGILAAQQKAVRAIRNEWDPKIADLQAKVAEYQKKVDEYDQRLGAMAKKQEELITNQQRLFQMEKDKQSKYYESQLADLRKEFGDYRRDSEDNLKRLMAAVKANNEQEVKRLVLTYNPLFTEPEIQRLIADSPAVTRDNPMAAYEDIFSQEKLWTPEAYKDLGGKVSAIKVLYDKVKSIPFTNSVPKALSALELRSFDIFQQYDLLWTKTAAKIRDKNTEIRNLNDYQDRLLFALETYGSTIRENGFVVDGRNADNLLIQLQKIYPIKDGSTATVFRSDDEEIAKIELKVVDKVVYGKVVSLKDDKKPVQAFDRILLNLK